ncbi:MAG: hypothetical protein WC612_04875 [Bdellovibrionales bacterium]|jgi:type II secretory pathway pseudopilin PulG
MKTISLKTSQRGFSLTETAIVFGVIGLVLAAIWATASVVRERQPIQDTVQLVTEIANNVRGVYSGFSNSTAAPPSTPSAQVAAGLFPDSVVNKAEDDTINAWGGTFLIQFPAAPRYGFSIEMTLPATMDKTDRLTACLGMITRLPATATNYGGGFAGSLPSGLVAIDPTQNNSPSLAFVRNGGAWVPVTKKSVNQITTDTTDCTGVAFYYKL